MAGITTQDLKKSIIDALSSYGVSSDEIRVFMAYANGDAGIRDNDPRIQAVYQKTGLPSKDLAEMSQTIRMIDKEGFYGNANDFQDLYTKWQGMRGTNTGATDETAQRQDITGQIQAFIDNLRGPLNDDPVYQQIAKQAINAAQAQAGRAGMSGRSGLAATNAAAVTQTTSAPYYAARQSALAGGLALQNQRDLGLGQLQAQKAALESQLAKDTWAAQQNAAQGVGAAIGGGIGALGFIGGPALGAATMSAGAAIGGGLGGMVGAPQAPNFSLSQGRSSRPGVNPYTGY